MFRTSTELSADPVFRPRVVRLIGVSAVALGIIWSLWERRLDTAPWIGFALAGGWILMPTLLTLSLHWPKARYGLVVPASLVSLALLGISLGALPDDRVAAAGWLLMTAGILLGGALGAWFWFRILPVPAALDRPFTPSRWLLVGVHSALVAVGALLIELEGTF